MFCCYGNKIFYTRALAFFLIAFGLVSSLFWKQVFYKILDKNFAISPSVFYYDSWISPTETIEINVYLFNWTNPEDFLNHSTKPILQECGPYKFTQEIEKINVTWHAHNDSVSYRIKSFLYFDREGSNGTLEDKVYSQNVVALTAASKSKDYGFFKAKMLSTAFDLFKEQREVHKTIDELFISGYRDKLLSMSRTLPGKENANVPDKFGWFYGFNGSSTTQGSFNIYTGAKNASKKGKVHTWNYVNHTGFFDSQCGNVYGSAGEFHESNLQPGGVIYLFSPELCRPVPLEYSGIVKVHGVTGYKYVAGSRLLDNGTLYPENKCLCNKQCLRSGVYDVSRCRLNSPLFISQPHFYQADPFYLSSVKGLRPDKQRHEFYVVKEPKTGSTLEIVANFQLNVLVEPYSYLSIYKNAPRIFFPTLWLEKRWRIAPEKADGLKMMQYVYWGAYVLGGLACLIGLFLFLWTFCFYKKWMNSKKNNILLVTESENPRIVRKCETPMTSTKEHYGLLQRNDNVSS